ncbi:hypothetical protein Amsp01_074880 [Amycolatopsis sp. NBRC 101858]|uniref:WXG100 family type VII secretion target n=1 Tax=Amycolatopsis sp. NBRC 101858 TaxID=3032200 RepID=UPI0024A0829C|nr:hypothetical protein [Amycolatopsis sp. NBRC 101858]GLY41465.1 hypothetical protein Amsp01_074880 [Amycolatopsis sp. NBRC 101858]
MSGGYEVDPGRMRSLIATLEQAQERMTSAGNALKDASPHDLGSRDIDAAGGRFRDRWEYGIGKIGAFSGSVAEGLTRAEQVYAETEQKVAGALDRGGLAPPPLAGESEICHRLDGTTA